MSSPTDRQRIAGIDYGTVRIGIAVATSGVGIASPFENYTRRGETQDERYFRDLAEQEKIVVSEYVAVMQAASVDVAKFSKRKLLFEALNQVLGIRLASISKIPSQATDNAVAPL